ncbi:MAG: methyl-accepting chemotaxis protein [Candidatus Omnitrophica bacterium]|nr:methyl-accepting chemotaxis protein [Candidatus Omnitrophota bacterium]
MVERFQKSLGMKITFCLSLILIVVFGLIATVNIIHGRSILLNRAEGSAEEVLDIITVSIRPFMFNGDNDKVQELFDKFKRTKSIDAIQLLDLNGIITVSTDRSLIGKKSSAKGLAEALKGQEVSGVELRARSNQGRNYRVYAKLKPILNGDGKVAGILRFAGNWESVQGSLTLIRNRSIMLSLLGLVLISSLVFFLLKAMLTNPINMFIKAAVGLASRAGDLTQRLEVNSQDEIGSLADVFNLLISSTNEMVLQIHSTADRVASSSQELSSSTEEVSAATQEISNAIQQISRGATNQASRVDEASEIMKQAALSLKKVLMNTNTAVSRVSEASSQAESGRGAAQETVDKINRLTETVTNTAAVIKGLGEKSQQIGEITETITSIADQTNLLALNAAIEAARAGEAGRGFAVVAEEVRKLAEGSAVAVRKIGTLIKSIQTETNRAVSSIEASSKEVQEGKDLVNRITESIVQFNRIIQENSGLFNQISVATQDQAKGVERVLEAVNQISTVAKDSVSTAEGLASTVEEQTASMQEIAASAQELARFSTELRDIVGRFKLKADNK